VTLSRVDTAKYILAQLELHSRGTDELTLSANKKVHLEHIYPQKPAEGERLSNHATLINRIGNFTLLDHRLNISIKNLKFTEKKIRGYSGSELNLTKDLFESPAISWGKDEIVERQKRLAVIAARVWAWDDLDFEGWEQLEDVVGESEPEISADDLPEDVEDLAHLGV